MTNHVTDIRNRLTPIPTPVWVRTGTSILLATAIAAMVSTLPIATSIITAAICIIAGFVLVFAHPYRRDMRSFADKHNVTMLPTIAQLVPLFILWLIVMTAPLFTFPLWATIATWIAIFSISFFVFPHVDGSRKLAYA